MKILESKAIDVSTSTNVYFIRIDPEDVSATLSELLTVLMNLSWLKKFDDDFMQESYKQRADITISDIKKKFDKCDDSNLTKDAGEYIVSELARESIVSELNYLDIPLGELLGKQKSGNPGFDFYSQNITSDTIIFGEAKYVSRQSAYPSALKQIPNFIKDKKDIADLADLKDFCSPKALSRVIKGKKGYAAAFSSKSTSSDKIIESIKQRDDFNELLKYEEIILVAVNL